MEPMKKAYIQIAKEVASKIENCDGRIVDRVIVIFTYRSGKIGTASWGETREVCKQNGKLADELIDYSMDYFTRKAKE